MIIDQPPGTITPDCRSDLLFWQGWQWQQQQRPDNARQAFQQALACQPDHLDATLWLGILAFQLGDYPQAVDWFHRTLRLAPGLAAAHYNLGLALQEQGEPAAARQAYLAAIRCAPEKREAYNNLATVLLEQGEVQQALDCLSLLLAQHADYDDAWFNRGVACSELGRIQEAIGYYQHAVALTPEHASAQFALAVAWLTLGEWRRGWPQYDWRWDYPSVGLNRPPQQGIEWDGVVDLAGQHLLLEGEQGFGDILQFCRFACLCRASDARVTLRVPATLRALLTSLGDIEVISDPSPVTCDYQLSLMSLPARLRIEPATVPLATGYLHADELIRQRWRDWLGPRQAPRIGLVWAGNPRHHNDARRSMDLSTLLAALPQGYDYIILQHRINAEERQLLQQQPNCRRPEHGFADFADTAGLCAELDLVISVDTAVAHLAGALGKPVWILLPWLPDWRWMLDQPHSPWYRHARLFRQPAPGAWSPILQQLAQALTEQIPLS